MARRQPNSGAPIIKILSVENPDSHAKQKTWHDVPLRSRPIDAAKAVIDRGGKREQYGETSKLKRRKAESAFVCLYEWS
jgi:hypothetical protein